MIEWRSMRPYIVLLIVGICFAQSQPPSPALPKIGHDKQETRAPRHEQIEPQNRKPSDSTVVVNEYYSQPNDEDKSQRDAKHNEATSKGWVDWLLVGSTFLLFLATVALSVIAGLQ